VIREPRPNHLLVANNILPPYRLSLFNEMSKSAGGRFSCMTARETHPKRRSWTIDHSEAHFDWVNLECRSLVYGNTSIDLALAPIAEVERRHPSLLLLAGWDQSLNWSLRRWALRKGVPFVPWVESTQSTTRARWSWLDRLRGTFLKGAAAVAVPGSASARRVRDLGFTGEFVDLPNAIDDRVAPGSKVPRTVVFVGEMSTRKGVDIIIDAAPKLLSRGFRLELIGAGGLAPKVEMLARSHPGTVAFHGHLDEASVRAALGRADVLLLPSRSDPWPLVAVEALAAGCHVVLGPGVGSAEDLGRRHPMMVTRMLGTTSTELTEAIEPHLPAEDRVGLAPNEYRSSAVAASFFKQAERLGLW
jgi:glycosyltransferase involved in cell wall biosynthesis